MNIYSNMKTVTNYDYEKDSCLESNFGPTMTDDSEYETLQQILVRCLRGDFSRVVENLNDGFDENTDDDTVLGSMNIQDTTDYDISDKTRVDLEALEAQKSLKKDKLKKEDANASDKVARPKKTSEEAQSVAKQSEEPQA